MSWAEPSWMVSMIWRNPLPDLKRATIKSM